MSAPRFTYDWFTPIQACLERHVPTDARRVLEIGCFEGRATVFFCNHCPAATVTVIDHFKGGSDMLGLDLLGLKERFLANVQEYGDRVIVFDGDSWDMMRHLEREWYDVVFVDGSHVARDVMHDLVEAYRTCKVYGLLIADDYSWHNELPDCPKTAIDAFVKVFEGAVELIGIQDRMALIKKLC